MCDSCGCASSHSHSHDHSSHTSQVIEVHESLLAANNAQAALNRTHFNAMGAIAINLISSPGSGKTTLLEQTVEHLRDEFSIGVLEGDIETDRDGARIRAKGIPVVQITTGGACHLDARLIHNALHQLTAGNTATRFDLIFIENVGNLVCPASFDLGEHQRVVLLSVPEGSDKPAKYPRAFQSSQVFIITKTDLLPYFDFSMEEVSKEALSLNSSLQLMELSAKSGAGFAQWLAYLRSLVS